MPTNDINGNSVQRLAHLYVATTWNSKTINSSLTNNFYKNIFQFLIFPFADPAAAGTLRDPDLQFPRVRAGARAPLDAGAAPLRGGGVQHRHLRPGDRRHVPRPRVPLGLRQHRGPGAAD